MIRPAQIACRVTLAVCPALLLLAACAKKDAEEGAAEAKAVVAAKTAVASVEPFTHTISAIGSVALTAAEARAGPARTAPAAVPTNSLRLIMPDFYARREAGTSAVKACLQDLEAR